MRIPTYDNKVTPSSGQVYRSVAQPRSDDLEAVISGIGSIADEMKRRNDEAIAISDYTNMANADLAITQLGESIKDEIANGGKYSDAVKRFNDGYAKIQSQYANVVQDPRSRAEFSVRSQRAGLQYNLSLKDAVRSRSRADATSAANNKVALLQDQLVRMETGMGPVDPKARQAILAEMSSTIAPLERMGVLSAGEGQSKMRGIIADAEKNIIRVMAENDPQKALTRLESSYQSGSLDTDTYASMLGPVKNAVEADIKARKADITVSNWLSGDLSKAPDRDDVDQFFNNNVIPSLEGMDAAQTEEQIVTYANSVGMLPTSIESGLVSRMSAYSPNMTASEKASIASSARVVSNLDYNVIKRDGGLSDDDLMKARIINDRLNSGMPEADAVDSVLSFMDGKDTAAVYKSAQKELYSLSDKGVTIGERIPSVNKALGAKGSNSDIWRSSYEDAYATARINGAGKDEAHKEATRSVKDRYGSFNGVVVENPITNFIDKSVLKKAEPIIINYAKEAVRSVVPDVDSAKIVVSGNRDTIAQRNAGANYWDMDFVVSVMYPGDSYPTPVTDGLGNIATIRLDEPQLGMKPKKQILAESLDIQREALRIKQEADKILEQANGK